DTQIQVLTSLAFSRVLFVTATSNATSAVVDNSSLSVAVTGTAKEGATLTATPTIGDSDDSAAPVTYQWQEKISGVWTDISGAHSSTYLVTEANEGNQIQVLASFTDDTSVLVSATSNATSAVVDNSSLSVAVTGTAKSRATLTAPPPIDDSDDSAARVTY